MHILLTGGTRGIGKAIKNTFSLSGHTVISPTKQELDLCDIEQVENYVKTLPDIDIIINNAVFELIMKLSYKMYENACCI